MQEFFGASASGEAPSKPSKDLVQGADSGFTPADSPEAPQRSEVGVVVDDTDSDNTPLSCVLRSDSAAGPDVVAVATNTTSSIPFKSGDLEDRPLLSAGRLRFSPDAPARQLSGHIEANIDIDLDDDEEDLDAEISSESSQQACAMGKYLYDVEEARCAVGGGASEPPVPQILQGIAVPALADHAEWLGKREVFNGLALGFYIGSYDFYGLRIDESLRRLCSHIFLRGESQVIDRLLVALAQRFVECNPDTTLRSVD
ncbi:hypothetical protein GGI21_005424, partial [Coemansia aciculifera]